MCKCPKSAQGDFHLHKYFCPRHCDKNLNFRKKEFQKKVRPPDPKIAAQRRISCEIWPFLSKTRNQSIVKTLYKLGGLTLPFFERRKSERIITLLSKKGKVRPPNLYSVFTML